MSFVTDPTEIIVIANAIPVGKGFAVDIHQRRADDFSLRAIKTLQCPAEIPVTPKKSVRAIADLINICIQRSGGNLMQ